MYTFISMLRGIIVGGGNKIRMPELKDLYESLNLTNVVTYVQSGNVIFDCAEGDAGQIARLIEAEIERSFRHSVPVFMRDRNRFKQIIDGNPFANERNEDPAKLHVTFLSSAPSELALSNLAIPTDIYDQFFVFDKEIYLFCPNGYGRTKLSNSFFERKLRVLATTRNWKTVNALYDIANRR
jgi:uncharacterized protein (DUF1697 family)